MTREEFLNRLQEAVQEQPVTLFLGAGVSVGSGIPAWHDLVLEMYCRAYERDGGLAGRPDYLRAIARWTLSQRRETLDLLARKVQRHYRDDAGALLGDVRAALYAQVGRAERENTTLRAIANLVRRDRGAGRRVQQVITYNYDDLLERALRPVETAPIWKARQATVTDALPVYHVHGYLPERDAVPEEASLVFTEEQYHALAADVYAWSNIVQIQCMASSIGLMIGLSLSDPNMRRLLDVVRCMPRPTPNFAILKRPSAASVGGEALDRIEAWAQEETALGGGGLPAREVRALLARFEEEDLRSQEAVLEELGIFPCWYDDHAEVAEILDRVW